MSPHTLPIIHDGIDDAQDFLCVRCSRRRQTCCQASEIFTTEGDVARIAGHTGQQEFFEYRVPTDPVYLEQDDDPLWREAAFQKDGTRRVLKKQANGDCTFLGSAGCVLPLETRPIVCRLYPFDYTEEGIRDELANGCPTYLLPEGTGLVSALDMRRTDAERWHEQIYQELREELAARQNRPE